jgi:hypothetical protein
MLHYWLRGDLRRINSPTLIGPEFDEFLGA